MASLVLMTADGGGVHHPLRETITNIGRDHECHIQVVDERVSRHHLQIVHEAPSPRYVARDARSANGVSVNGRRIDIDTTLSDGDRITIGTTELMFLQDDHPSEAAALAAAKKRKDQWHRETVMKTGSTIG